MIGAAIATTMSRFFNIVSSGVLSWRKLGIYPEVSSIYKPVISSFAMFLLFYFLPYPKTIILGIFELLFAIVFYFIFMILIKGIKVDDFKYVRLVFKIGATSHKNK